MLGGEGMLSLAAWPEFDESKTREDSVEMAVQICGKVRAKIVVAADASDDDVIAEACKTEKVAQALESGKIMKSIVVKNKLVNLILKPQA